MASRDHTGSAIAIACAVAAALFAGIYVGVVRPLLLQSELSGISAVAPAEKEAVVTNVSLNQKKANLKVGDTLKLEATVYPTDATNKDVTWESSDTKIAVVRKDGTVSALKTGKATITVKTVEGDFTATCEITIKNPVTGISINPKKVTVGVGKTVTLKAGVYPFDADEKEITWASNNSGVASVDQKGVVTGVKAGTATITVSTKDGKFTANCSVKVAVPVTGISLDKSEAKLAVGETIKLRPTIKPENAAVKSIKWETSDKEVATIENDGTVKALKPGATTITITTKDGGHKATCKVTVINPVKEIKLDKDSAEVQVGKTLTLTATISPSDATDKTVTWSSSDKAVATVDSKGVVTAVKPGTATITASAKGKDGDVKATCTVKVTAAVTGVSLDRSDASLKVGESLTLTATVSPAEATKRDVTWSSSDTSVATVSDTGVVSAVKAGSATITATTAEGGFKATCNVKVSAPSVTGVSLDRSEASLKVGESVTLSASVSPSDAANRSVTWSSSDSSVASVDGNGVVTAAKAGKATIKVTTDDGGFKASCTVTVSAPSVTGVSLDRSEASLKVGESVTLSATVSPSDASNRNVTWSSSDSSVASVDGSGVVSAAKAGKATITVTTEDGGFKASCTVTVAAPGVSGVSLDQNDVSLSVGESVTLSATVSPDNASDRSVSWSSSDSSVATVSDKGAVKAVGGGTATITVTTNDGGYSDSCTVRVSKPVIEVTGVSLDADDVSLSVGESFGLTATVKPSDAADKGVSWSSSDSSVASVNGSGSVVAKGKGTATIIVTTDDGGYSASCTVRVSQPVSGVSLDASDVTLNAGEGFGLVASVSPSNANDKGVSWDSSDSSVASVDGSGSVVAKGKGSATITVTTDDGGYSASCIVRVSQPVTGVSLDQNDMTISVGKSATLTATVTPGDADNRDVSWSSSDSSVATVDGGGKVTGKKKGTATITVTTSDGEYSDACDVTVK